MAQRLDATRGALRARGAEQSIIDLKAHRMQTVVTARAHEAALSRGSCRTNRRTADLYRHRTMSAGVEIGLFEHYFAVVWIGGGKDQRPSIKLILAI
jgi:hypothetical protein